ncbi:hypothetical protein D3C81_1663700 [compost metagenome]
MESDLSITSLAALGKAAGAILGTWMRLPALLRSTPGLSAFSRSGEAWKRSPSDSSTLLKPRDFSFACSAGFFGMATKGPATSSAVSV